MQKLILTNIKKSFPTLEVLKNVSLQLNAGEALGLIGKNGAGKSTLLNTICTIHEPEQGEIIICGKPIKEGLRHLSYVPQENNCLLPEKLINIILDQAGLYSIPKKLAVEQAEILLKRFNLWSKRKNPVYTLSTGQIKLLMLCSALITNPDVLLLDELTASLDANMKNTIFQELNERLRQGMSIILSTHQVYDIYALCQKFAFLSDGIIKNIFSRLSLPEILKAKKLILYVSSPYASPPDELKDNWKNSGNSIEILIQDISQLPFIYAILQKNNVSFYDYIIKPLLIEECFEIV